MPTAMLSWIKFNIPHGVLFTTVTANCWYSTSRPMTSLLSRKRSKIWIHSIYVSRWALLVLSSLRSWVIWETAAAIRDIPDIPTSCSCHNSLRRSAVSSRRNCSSFPVFIFSGVRSGNIHTMLPPMLWGISVRYPLKIWRRMKRDTTSAEIM